MVCLNPPHRLIFRCDRSRGPAAQRARTHMSGMARDYELVAVVSATSLHRFRGLTCSPVCRRSCLAATRTRPHR